MVKYVYHYFNLRGRGETPRLIFAAAGKEYENIRHEFSEWPALKAQTPLGSLPFLEVDGKKYGESVSISRFLAREFGLEGRTNVEKLQADVIVEGCITLREGFVKVHFEKDDAKKAEHTKKLVEEEVPKYFGYTEKILSGNSSGFLVGTQLTWADLALSDLCQMLIPVGVVAKFPKIAAHKKKIDSQPKIAAYIKSRPDSAI